MRARVALAAVCAAAIGIGGCSAAGTQNVSVKGTNLSVYVASPAGQGAAATDVALAEQLAFNQRAHEITAFKLHLHVLHGARPSDNARTAIEDTSAVAYLGEPQPGTSSDSVGITNAEQLLQVSGADTAQGLTDSHTPGLTNVPNKYLESVKTYGRTFGRVVPNTAVEAKVIAAELTALHVHTLYIGTDRSDYATGLALALKGDVSGVGLNPGPLDPGRAGGSGADAVLAATRSPAAGRAFLAAVAASHPSTTLLGPSALADASLFAGLPATAKVYVSAPGFTKSATPATAASFTSQFRASYGHAPAPQAIFGYEAMNAALAAIKQGGSNRGNVIHDFLNHDGPASSVIGPYKIDVNGDTNLTAFVIERVSAGRVTAVTQPQG